MSQRTLPLLRALAGLLLGLACLSYGYAVRKVTVLVEPPQAAAVPEAPSIPGEPAPPPPAAKEPILVAEGEMVRDATVGGIARLPDGQLVRTYVGGPTQACPT